MVFLMVSRVWRKLCISERACCVVLRLEGLSVTKILGALWQLSDGQEKIKLRKICLNPGSTYSEGGKC